MKFINLCLSIPNLDTIIFYLIFVITIPGILFSTGDYESLKFYLPALVMAAVTLTEAGKPDVFTNLYPTECSEKTNFSGFLSTNIINGLAIVGILLQSLTLAAATSSITLGLVSGIIIFAITFPMAQQILPYFIREVDDLFCPIEEGGYRNCKLYIPGRWHLYLAGTIFSIFLLLTEYILLIGFSKYILSTGMKLI
jgi:hypothetical protein